MKILVLRNRNVLNVKWMVYFVNLLSEQGHEMVVVADTYAKLGSGCDFDRKVKLINLSGKTDNFLLNLYHKIREKIIPPYWRYKKVIKREKPDILIAYFPVDLFNATFFQNHNIPIIQMIHGYPPAVLSKYLQKRYWVGSMYRKAFSQVSVFQVLLPSYKDTIKFANEVTDIPNVVFPVKQENSANLTDEKHTIVYVARVEEKGKRQHLAVEAFGKIAKDFPQWKMEFWGTCKYPEYEKKLNDLAKKYHIEKQVRLCGYNDHIEEVYKNADLQVFPSAHEGFSLGLTDGMAAGLPSIGFSDAPCVNELIHNGENGFLVNDVDEFAEKLRILLADKDLRIRFGKQARKDMDAYTPEKIIARWNNLLNYVKEKYHA